MSGLNLCFAHPTPLPPSAATTLPVASQESAYQSLARRFCQPLVLVPTSRNSSQSFEPYLDRFRGSEFCLCILCLALPWCCYKHSTAISQVRVFQNLSKNPCNHFLSSNFRRAGCQVSPQVARYTQVRPRLHVRNEVDVLLRARQSAFAHTTIPYALRKPESVLPIGYAVAVRDKNSYPRADSMASQLLDLLVLLDLLAASAAAVVF